MLRKIGEKADRVNLDVKFPNPQDIYARIFYTSV